MTRGIKISLVVVEKEAVRALQKLEDKINDLRDRINSDVSKRDAITAQLDAAGQSVEEARQGVKELTTEYNQLNKEIERGQKDLAAAEEEAAAAAEKIRAAQEAMDAGKANRTAFAQANEELEAAKAKANELRAAWLALQGTPGPEQAAAATAYDQAMAVQRQWQTEVVKLNNEYRQLEPTIRAGEQAMEDAKNEAAAAAEKIQAVKDKMNADTARKDSLTGDIVRGREQVQNIKSLISERDRLTRAIDRNGESLKKADVKAAELQNKLRKVNFGAGLQKATVRLKASFKDILRYAFGIRSVFVLVNRIRRAISEGLQEFIKFDPATNRVYTSIQNAIKKVKSALVSAFIPILTAIEPIIQRLANWLSAAAEKVGMFIAALTGATMYKRAVAHQNEYTKAIDKSAKSAKKLSDNLTGLDEMNTMTGDTGSTSDADEQNSVISGVEAVPISNETLQKAEKLRHIFGLIGEILRPIAKLIERIVVSPAFIQALELVKTLITWVVEQFIKFLEWLDRVNDASGGILVIAAVLTVIGIILLSIITSINWIAVLIAVAIVAIATLIGYVVENWDEIKEKLVETWENIKTKLSEAWDHIKEKFKEGWEELKGDFERAKAFLEKVFRGYVNIFIRILNWAINKINGLIRAINAVSIAGVSANIPTIKNIPLLARGGIVNGPTTAVIGESGKEAVIPLERNTGWITELARSLAEELKNIMPGIINGSEVPRAAVPGVDNTAGIIAAINSLAAALGAQGGGSYTFTAEVDRKTLFREVIEEGRLQKRRDGKNPFSLA